MSFVKFCLSHNYNKTFPIKNLKFFSSSPQTQEQERAKKTSLFDFHVARGGKIVNFAGYLLPVQYADQGLVQSHVHTRTPGCASIFDVREKFFFYFNSNLSSKFFLGFAYASDLRNRKKRDRMHRDVNNSRHSRPVEGKWDADGVHE